MLTERSSRGQVPKVPSAFTGLRRRRRHWPWLRTSEHADVRAGRDASAHLARDAQLAAEPQAVAVDADLDPRLPFGHCRGAGGGAGGTGPAFAGRKSAAVKSKLFSLSPACAQTRGG